MLLMLETCILMPFRVTGSFSKPKLLLINKPAAIFPPDLIRATLFLCRFMPGHTFASMTIECFSFVACCCRCLTRGPWQHSIILIFVFAVALAAILLYLVS